MSLTLNHTYRIHLVPEQEIKQLEWIETCLPDSKNSNLYSFYHLKLIQLARVKSNDENGTDSYRLHQPNLTRLVVKEVHGVRKAINRQAGTVPVGSVRQEAMTGC